MSLAVVEVLGRAKEGRTEPYICRCDDDNVYFVKGNSATRSGLIAELICARLAQKFGLPLAPYEIAVVPEALFGADPIGYRDLGVGPVFASKRVVAAGFTEEHRHLVPLDVRRDVLAFDWWVRNCDRNLTAMGGNPNLLWDHANDGGLVVIDHNLAFDPQFSAADFVEVHVFADDISLMFSDFLVRQAYSARFAATLGILDEACENVPESWKFIDPEETVPVGFDCEHYRAVLSRFQLDDFWQLPA